MAIINLDKYKFATVTFEHDSYNDGTDIRDASRKYFEDHGYVLIADNIFNCTFTKMLTIKNWIYIFYVTN